MDTEYYTTYYGYADMSILEKGSGTDTTKENILNI